ncbi:MAG: phosphoadenosine phosphosulfate reductase [FCB group bacterium]|nr:phosphoadenosine phosphosulfate reductase [FCB group bacterium]
MSLRTWSSGGGVQSIAGLVLSARGVIDFPVHLFCNTGDDSENPNTLDYVHNVAMPYAKKHGIEYLELRHTFKSKKYIERYGEGETLLGRIYRTRKSVPIPIRRSGGFPLSRTCTVDFKIKVIAEWLRENGATTAAPAISAIGFSIDEWSRVKNNSGFNFQKLVYPLSDLGMSRQDCIKLIDDEGLPIPHKSACWFCPHTQPLEWVQMADTNPAQFSKAVELERFLSAKYGEPLFLHKYLVPLPDAVKQLYFSIDTPNTQDCVGHCFT